MRASAQAVETLRVSTAGAATAATAPPGPEAVRRRVPARAIELIGLALGIAFITAVALGHSLSNDEFWSLAAGQWMLSHHRMIGLDPFSYTESHRRWVTDEWGSELALAGLFRAFGAWAYALYAIGLGGLCLVATRAYVRALGARGGRVALILVVLALGLAGVLVGDRGLDFSLVWLPVELYLLTRARRDPRWLAALPLLCLLWVNTHGSILVGLGVLIVELAWSFAPEGWAARLGGFGRSPHTGAIAVALVASLVASCVTPYGPGLLLYDIGVSTNGQIGQYISEWNSPDFHSLAVALVFLVPLVVLVACIRNRHVLVLEGTLGAVLFVEALRTQRLVIYLMVVAAGLAATLPTREWDPVMRKLGGAAFAVAGIACLAAPAVPAGCGVVVAAGAGLQRPARAPRADLHRVHVGRLLHRPAPGHLRRRAHRPLRGERADGVLRHHQPDDEPGPRALGVSRRLCRVGARDPAGRVPAARPALARGGPDAGGAGVRPPVAGSRPPAQGPTASRPRTSPSSSVQVSTER